MIGVVFSANDVFNYSGEKKDATLLITFLVLVFFSRTATSPMMDLALVALNAACFLK